MDAVKIYTDGASRGNGTDHSICAWCYIIYDAEDMKECFTETVGYTNRTNNAMELEAVVESIKACSSYLNKHEGVDLASLFVVEIITDSKYVVDAVNKEWLKRWNREGFMNKGQERPNTELWKELSFLLELYDNITFTHVKGHSDNPYNEEADKRCNIMMDKIERGDITID